MFSAMYSVLMTILGDIRSLTEVCRHWVKPSWIQMLNGYDYCHMETLYPISMVFKLQGQPEGSH